MARQQTPPLTSARISVLNAALADQIAAGEVVERPASVVKELVENAIDAGATRVDVELEKGGLESIRVLDNGAGIHPEDLPIAIMRHGTSKVRGPEDLVDIQTLGFRGEALASVAAVAHLSLRSRRQDAEVGAEIRTIPGETPAPAPVGMPTGTQVEVRGLFSNVPARRKFMRSEATEVGHCSETLLRIALIHPEVHLVLRHGRRELLNLPSGELGARVGQILERRATGPFFAFSGEEDGIRVDGWLADPRRASGGRSGLYIVTRRRVVKERNISQILSQALGDALSGKGPIGCLIVEPPPATVDVNVHPQKSEIRFSDPQRVYAAVRRILGRELVRAPWAAAPVDLAEAAENQDVHGDMSEEDAGEREGSDAGAAIDRWVAKRPEPEAPSVRGPETPAEGKGIGPGPSASRWRGESPPPRPSVVRKRSAPPSYDPREGSSTSAVGAAAPVGDATFRAAAASQAPSAAREAGRGYRLSTRALDPSYSAHKRDVRAATAELRGAREVEVAPAEPPSRPAIGPLFAGVSIPVDEAYDDDEEDDDEALAAAADDAEGEARESAGPALPRLLTCLPGPVAIFSDEGGDADEPGILAVDLRALRSHLVFQRLMRDLKASKQLAVQGLLQPVVVRCVADEVRLCVGAQAELLDLGIDLDAFGDDAVVVRGVPAHLRSCLDDADVTDLMARVIPWLRLRASDRRRAEPAALLTAIAATEARDPAPRLARRWIAELIDGGENLADVPGVARWTAAALLGKAASQA